MIQIDQNLRELRESIVYISTNCNHADYPTEFQSYAEAWEELSQSIDYLQNKLGDARYMQLLDMAAQAKAHYDKAYAITGQPGVRPALDTPGFEEIKLGSWLMQDMEQIVRGKPPFAYPEDLYRWPK
jgi:hypothetical protein